MYKVCITFLVTKDEFWGYPCRYYDFNNKKKALAFYALKKSEYKDDKLVSVDLYF